MNPTILSMLSSAILSALLFAGPPARPHIPESPIEVVGGSIEINPHGTNNNLACTGHTGMFCPATDDVSKLTLRGVGIAHPPSLAKTYGWRIRLSNKDPMNSRHDDAVRLCSDPDCKLIPGDGKTVYISVRGDAEWVYPHGQTQPHFHDRTNCPNNGNEDKRCDILVDVTIETSKPAKARGACGTNAADPACTIILGTHATRVASR